MLEIYAHLKTAHMKIIPVCESKINNIQNYWRKLRANSIPPLIVCKVSFTLCNFFQTWQPFERKKAILENKKKISLKMLVDTRFNWRWLYWFLMRAPMTKSLLLLLLLLLLLPTTTSDFGVFLLRLLVADSNKFLLKKFVTETHCDGLVDH